jgi:hypothetical protein
MGQDSRFQRSDRQARILDQSYEKIESNWQKP